MFNINFIDETKPIKTQIEICENLLSMDYNKRFTYYTNIRHYIRNKLIELFLVFMTLLLSDNTINHLGTVSVINYTLINAITDITLMCVMIYLLAKLLDIMRRLSNNVLKITIKQLKVLDNRQQSMQNALSDALKLHLSKRSEKSDK